MRCAVKADEGKKMYTDLQPASCDVEKSDDELEDNDDENYYDYNEEGNIPRKTHVDHATPDEWYHQHRSMMVQMQIVLKNQTLKRAEWEGNENKKN